MCGLWEVISYNMLNIMNIGILAAGFSSGTYHPFSIVLNSVTYYHDNIPLQKNDIIYINQYGNDILQNTSGRTDLDNDGNSDDWTVGISGQISWDMYIAHPYSFVSDNNTYHHENPTIYQSSVLYLGMGDGASVASNASGLYDIDNDNNIDEWTTDEVGRIYFQPYIFYKNSIMISGIVYYFNDTPTSGVTILYQTPYSGSSYHTFGGGNYITGNMYDWDNDGNLDEWNIGYNGLLSFSQYNAYPYYFTIDNLYFYSDSAVWSQGMNAKTGSGTGASNVANTFGQYDIDNDSNIDYWDISNGQLNWSMVIVHPYYLDLSNIGTYGYIDIPVVENGSMVFNSQGSGASPINSYSGFGSSSDINGDGIIEDWIITPQGAITW
jgi:hypothetical protein